MKKTPCTSAVLNFFQCSWNKSFKLSHLVNVLRRNGFQVRSRRSTLAPWGKDSRGIYGPLKTVSQLSKRLAKNNETGFYMVIVPGHVLLLDCDGRVLVDTAPRKTDRRKVRYVYNVKPTTKAPVRFR